MSAVAKMHRVEAVRPGEVCEASCPALAKIAFLMVLNNGRTDRVVLCAHHFAGMNQESRAKIVAKHESA